ncbi:MAG: carbohydrate ABC transporter permease [Clostridia bacterium]|nr:carbohydrate ABC transporter permease [Clostridia bacterium]
MESKKDVTALRLKQYKKLNTVKKVSFAIFRYFILFSIGYLVVYPLIYMISSAFKSPEDFMNPGIVWLAQNPTWQNFKDAFKVLNFTDSLKNTITLEMVSAVLEILSCSVAAYGLARFDFPTKKITMAALMMTIIVPSTMIIIPTVVNFSNLDFLGIVGLINKITGADIKINILDTPLTFYLPSIFGVGLRSGIMIFIYMQFFKGLPKELEEAAQIDGASAVATFIRIALPSSRVVILTVSVFAVIWHWNDYYLSVMYTSQDYPLAVAAANMITTITSSVSTNSDIITAVSMAGCLMFIMPVLIAYMFVQKGFIKSIDRVGITG